MKAAALVKIEKLGLEIENLAHVTRRKYPSTFHVTFVPK